MEIYCIFLFSRPSRHCSLNRSQPQWGIGGLQGANSESMYGRSLIQPHAGCQMSSMQCLLQVKVQGWRYRTDRCGWFQARSTSALSLRHWGWTRAAASTSSTWEVSATRTCKNTRTPYYTLTHCITSTGSRRKASTLLLSRLPELSSTLPAAHGDLAYDLS